MSISFPFHTQETRARRIIGPATLGNRGQIPEQRGGQIDPAAVEEWEGNGPEGAPQE